VDAERRKGEEGAKGGFERECRSIPRGTIKGSAAKEKSGEGRPKPAEAISAWGKSEYGGKEMTKKVRENSGAEGVTKKQGGRRLNISL